MRVEVFIPDSVQEDVGVPLLDFSSYSLNPQLCALFGEPHGVAVGYPYK